jgi:hypothetical protein
MGIGRSGRRAQAMSKRHQRRYRPSYQEGDTTPLTLRRQTDPNLPQIHGSEQGSVRQPRDAKPLVQRIDESSVATEQPTDTQTSENDETRNAAAQEISAKEVADLVYKMMARDAKFDRERRGHRNTRL